MLALNAWMYQGYRTFSHSGTMLGDDDEREQPRRQQESRRNQHDHRRVVGLVARCHDGEQLRQRGADGNECERRPLLRRERHRILDREPARKERAACDQDEKCPRRQRQAAPFAGRPTTLLGGGNLRSQLTILNSVNGRTNAMRLPRRGYLRVAE